MNEEDMIREIEGECLKEVRIWNEIVELMESYFENITDLIDEDQIIDQFFRKGWIKIQHVYDRQNNLEKIQIFKGINYDKMPEFLRKQLESKVK